MTRRLVAALTTMVMALAWIQRADTAVGLDGSVEAKLDLPMVGSGGEATKRAAHPQKRKISPTLLRCALLPATRTKIK